MISICSIPTIYTIAGCCKPDSSLLLQIHEDERTQCQGEIAKALQEALTIKPIMINGAPRSDTVDCLSSANYVKKSSQFDVVEF